MNAVYAVYAALLNDKPETKANLKSADGEDAGETFPFGEAQYDGLRAAVTGDDGELTLDDLIDHGGKGRSGIAALELMQGEL